MSRQPVEPYTDEDIAYMRTRQARFSRILREIDAGEGVDAPKLAGKNGKKEESKSEEPKFDPDDVEYVNSLTNDELKDELRARDQKVTGKQDELRQRLLAVLATE